jgi:CheY-like chemotaxis protein
MPEVQTGAEGRGLVSDLERHTTFLVRRLQALGLEVESARDGLSATGRLPLSSATFETLGEPQSCQSAAFYTLGHNRLKFFDPPSLFDLPALDVSRCESARAIEAALRRSWSAAQRDLRKAREWLEGIGAGIGSGARGTRLLLALTGLEGPPAQVRSPTEILVPSAGPLSQHSLASPAERRFRPMRDLQHPADLELALAQAMERLATRPRTRAPAAPRPSAPPAEDAPRRLLLVDDDARQLAEAHAVLQGQGFEVDARQDARRALEVFRERTCDLVMVDVRMPRMDGLEFTARLRELPGIENLPVVLIDDRDNDHNRAVGESVRASAYLIKPLEWREVGEVLLDLLDHTNRRRFRRFPARLPLEIESGASGPRELTDDVSRLGLGIGTRRDLYPGAVERYRIALPHPHKAVELEGEVRHRVPVAGQATGRAGIRIRRFLD